ncbi:MAG: 30S ribosomal protein S4 [Patescibacteria group bacterium]|nr:MAG: 30S ribosomal protein S4 [Patescibacteria group bacterium]
MITGPKYKICRRLGSGVFEKCQTPKFALAEDRHHRNKRRGRRRKNLSDFALQLLEKQKMRYTYGVTEKQFSNYVKEALAKRGVNATERLHEHLETRLDNVVFLLGFAKTRPAARQMISHGHIAINGKRLNIPSYKVGVGNVLSIIERSKNKPLFNGLPLRLKKHKVPSWIKLDAENIEGVMLDKPKPDKDRAAFDLISIIEFYSR